LAQTLARPDVGEDVVSHLLGYPDRPGNGSIAGIGLSKQPSPMTPWPRIAFQSVSPRLVKEVSGMNNAPLRGYSARIQT
jgi:hypothetical protein